MSTPETTTRQFSSGLNLANNALWLLDIPITEIDPEIDIYHFTPNIVSFTLGRFGLGVNQVIRNGITWNMPTGGEDQDKQFTVFYNLSSDYSQYKFLMLWWQRNLKTIERLGPGIVSQQTQEILQTEPNFFTTSKLYLLNEYKEQKLQVDFEMVWLKEIGELQLDYKDGQSVISHSFTCYFSDYTIKTL